MPTPVKVGELLLKGIQTSVHLEHMPMEGYTLTHGVGWVLLQPCMRHQLEAAVMHKQ